MALIGLSLSDTRLMHVKGRTSAYTTCIFILNTLELRTLFNKPNAKLKFYMAKIKPDDSIVVVRNHMRHLAGSLKSMSVTIDDEKWQWPH